MYATCKNSSPSKLQEYFRQKLAENRMKILKTICNDYNKGDSNDFDSLNCWHVQNGTCEFRSNPCLLRSSLYTPCRYTSNPDICEMQNFKVKFDCLKESRMKTLLCAEGTNQFFKLEESIIGLGCKDNKTLNVYTANIDTQQQFAQNLGIKLSGSSPAAVIVSLSGDTVYLSDNVSLSSFVEMFHSRESSLKKAWLTSQKVKPKVKCRHRASSCMMEVSSDNFNEVVMDPNVNVVLLYKTSSCAFCSSGSPSAQVFHTVARVFNGSDIHTEGKLRFVMIDATVNDLRWHFTALSVPTVLFFPASQNINNEDSSTSTDPNKSHTRVFPPSKPLNVTNLLNFILANLDVKTRTNFSISKCLTDDNCKNWLHIQRDQAVNDPIWATTSIS